MPPFPTRRTWEPLRRHFRPGLERLEPRLCLATVQWTGGGDGQHWDDVRNWSSNALPTAADDVVISLVSNPTITHRNGTNAIRSLQVSNPLTLSGGTLRVSGGASLSNVLTLRGGTLADATVTGAAAGKILLTASGGTLSSVTIAAGTVVDGTQRGQFDFGIPHASITGPLTLHGTVNLGSANGNFVGELRFQDLNASLAGTGRVVFGSSTQNAVYAHSPTGAFNAPGVTLTIASGITIEGGSGHVRGRFVNDRVINQGTIRVPSGATVEVGGKNWSNLGQIRAESGSVLTFTGSSNLAALGDYTSSGVVNIAQELDNTGTTINLSPSRGSWHLFGGTIRGGEIAGSTDSFLTLTPSGGILAGVTIAPGTVVDATQKTTEFFFTNPSVVVQEGLTLHGTLKLGSTNGTINGNVYFEQADQTLSGTGTVEFGSATNNGLYARGDSFVFGNTPITLTIGSGITIGGGSGTVGGRYTRDSVIHQGTIQVPTGHTIAVGGKDWKNQGTITGDAGSFLTFLGTFDYAALGNFSSQGVVNIGGELNNVGQTLLLNPARGAWRLLGGTILGGTLRSQGQEKLTLTTQGGTLAGVTVAEGTVIDATLQVPDLILAVPNARVTGGLTLQGELRLGSADGRVSARLSFEEDSQTLAGAGTVILGSSPNNGLWAQGQVFSGSNPVTLTIGSGITIRGGSANIGGMNRFDSLVNEGTILVDGPGRVVALRKGIDADAIINSGTLQATNGATFHWRGSLEIRESAAVSIASNSTLEVGGDLLGTVDETPRYSPRGVTVFNGSGTAAQPQLLEAMSEDVGNAAAGYRHNFAYSTVIVTNLTYVKLVDRADNSPGNEAVYVDSLFIGALATLDLGGIPLYARVVQRAANATILNGTVTSIPEGGVVPWDSPVGGSISAAGQIDEWSLYGIAGRQATVLVVPGASGSPAPITPYLNWAQVSVLNPSGGLLTTGSSGGQGQSVALRNITFTETGLYRIRIAAAAASPSSTGNYVLTAWDTTARGGFLGLNELTSGFLGSPFSQRDWSFTAAANSQVQLRLLAEAFGGLGFRLTGPNGFVGFSGLAQDSGIVTLPDSGTYTLSAFGNNGTVGNFAFALNQVNAAPLSLSNPFRGSLFGGGGQHHFFTLDVAQPGPVVVNFPDLPDGTPFEFFGSFGRSPSRTQFDLSLFGGLSGQRSLTFDAQPGTYRFLLYHDLVNAPQDFTLQVTPFSLYASAVVPRSLGNSQPGTLLLKGIGFDAQTSVRFVAPDGTIRQPAQVRLLSETQLLLECDLPSWQPGMYDLQVTRGSFTALQEDAFEVTPGGLGKLVANLHVPVVFGRQDATQIGIEYFNAGEVALPVPQFRVSGSDQAILTLDPALRGRGFTTSTMPNGFASSVTFPGAGAEVTPTILQPGEIYRVPIYYRGLLQPWDLLDNEVRFTLSVQRGAGEEFEDLVTKTVPVVTSLATDAISGPVGLGLPNFFGPRNSLPFNIRFGSPTDSRVPTQEVVVTSQLDPGLDWNSFQWTGFGFGGRFFDAPAERQRYQTTIDTTWGGRRLNVLVDLDLQRDTGRLTAAFRSLDPDTALPPSFLFGFLPPEDGSGRGTGFVSYRVRPKVGLPSGTRIRNIAQIAYDQLWTVATDQVSRTDPGQGVDTLKQLLLTIDSAPPTSRVQELPEFTLGTEIPVVWEGEDDEGGSGLARYDVLVSVDGGPFTYWLQDTSLRAGTFVGQLGRRYAFQSIAIDEVGNRQAPSGLQAETLIVDPDSPPRDILLSHDTVAESAAAGSRVATLSTIDYRTHDVITFELVDSAGGRFALANNQIQIGFGEVLDFETATSHVIQVKATNQAGTFLIKPFTIHITDSNERPSNLVLSPSTVAENEDGAEVGTLTVVDPDAGDTFTFAVNDPRFEVVSSVLRLKAGRSLDFEERSSLLVRVTVTDREGLSFDKVFSIEVQDRNEPPLDIMLAGMSLKENLPGGSVGILSALDVDAGDAVRFSVEDERWEIVDGVLKLRPDVSLDFEVQRSVSVTITATDSAGLTLEKSFTISVENVNEPPESLTWTGSTVSENAVGAELGSVIAVDPDAGTVLTITVDEPRLELADHVLRLRRDVSLDFETEPRLAFTLTATDAGGLQLVRQFELIVINVNESPHTLLLSAPTIPENSAGFTIGSVTALDPDAGDVLTFTVDDERFEIVDGELRSKAGVTLNFEQEPTVSLLLKATDAGGLRVERSFEIAVTDRNERPVATGTIADQKGTAGELFELSLAADLFVDEDRDDTLTLRAARIGGEALPAWLTFDATSRTFRGTPAEGDLGELSIRLTAADSGDPSLEAHVEFRLSVEKAVNKFPWHNALRPLDVNHNDSIEPLDALLIINHVNEHGAGQLPLTTEPVEFYLDTNRDGFVSAVDVLLVVNHFNEPGTGEGESVVGAAIPERAASPEAPGSPAGVPAGKFPAAAYPVVPGFTRAGRVREAVFAEWQPVRSAPPPLLDALDDADWGI